MADEFMIREIKKLEAENAKLKEEISEQFIDMTKLVSEYRQEIAELTKIVELMAMGPTSIDRRDCTPLAWIEYCTKQAKEIIRKEENDEKDSDD